MCMSNVADFSYLEILLHHFQHAGLVFLVRSELVPHIGAAAEFLVIAMLLLPLLLAPILISIVPVVGMDEGAESW